LTFHGKIAEKMAKGNHESDICKISFFFLILDTILRKKSLLGQTCKMSALIYRDNFSFWVFFGQKIGAFRKVIVITAKNSNNDPTKTFL
jgi:hypothetical protein